MQRLFALAILSPLFVSPVSSATLAISSPSSAWRAVAGNYDFLMDQQTGQAAGDIVGNANNPGFFTAFDDNGVASRSDGTLAFRVRLDEAGGTRTSPAFDRVFWVGIDGNGNGSLDLFLGVVAQGGSSSIGLYSPGDSANTSPSTTSIVSSPLKTYPFTTTNYNYRPVDFALDGGNTNDLTPASSGDTDYYLSFSVPFSDIVAELGLNPADADSIPLRYVISTSTQKNSLNQDLGAVNGGVNSAITWNELGAFSPAAGAQGNVPESSSLALAAIALVGLVLKRRRLTSAAV